MSVITANTGSNNWNTGGCWVGGVQPTAADDVVIPASAVVTIPAATTVLGRSLTVAASGTLAGAATTSILNLGDATAGLANVAISIAATATITNTAVWTINLISTSATQQTIDSGGKTLPNVTVNGAGSSYVLSAALTLAATGTFSLTNGTFNSGSLAMSMASFTINNGTRTLTLGSSAITCTSGGVAFAAGTNTNMTMTATTAVVTCTAVFSSANNITLGSINFNGLSFVVPNGGQMNINNNGATIGSFTFTGRNAKTDFVGLNGSPLGTLTLTGTLTINGNSAINRVLFSNTVSRGTGVVVNAAAVSFSNIDMMDITAAGASAPWSLAAITGNSGDAQGNTNITFTTPATQTNTGATGNWSDSTKWTSRVPLPQDNVIINTGSGTITFDMPRLGKDIDFTGFTGTYTGGINWESYGSYTLSSGMTYGPIASGGFGGRGTHTITTNGKTPGATTTTFNGPGGTYTLQDPFTSSGDVQLTSGGLNTNNQAVQSLIFTNSSGQTRSLTLGTTVWTLIQTTATTLWNTVSTGLTFSGASSTIIFGVASASTRSFIGGGQVYGELRYTVASSTGILNITGGNTFNNLNVNGGARGLRIVRAVTTTIRNWNVFGTVGNLITIDTDVAANNTSISIPIGGVISSDYISIKDFTVKQPYKFYAGANSTNVSNNTNIVFTAPITAPYIHQDAAAASATGTSITATLTASATAGNLLVAMHTTTTGGTPVTTPSGWTLAKQSQYLTSTSVTIFYKIAAGGETGVTIANNSSVSLNLLIYEVAGFTGTPTLDVTDGNSVSSALSLSTTATTGPTNATPAFGIAGVSFNANPGTVSASNSYQISKSTPSAVAYWTAQPLLSAAAQSTLFSWTPSARQAATALAIFKDVALATSNGNFLMFM